MSVEVLTENSRFDPTPEQMRTKAAADWRAMLVAHETEQSVIADRVRQLQSQLQGLDLRKVTVGVDRTVHEVERLRVAGQLEHKTARLAHIADVIDAHRKAKP